MYLNPVQATINEYEFKLFQNYINKISGIIIPPEKAYLIESKLSKLMMDSGAENFGDFYDYIISNTDPGIAQKIINVIAINETMWFRDSMPWAVLEKIYLPTLVDEIVSGRKIKARIWCSAVSTGQEVYSAIICINEYLKKNPTRGVSLANFEFFATDISTHVIDIAQKGKYDRISISRGLSEDFREKYFRYTEAAWEISPEIKNKAKFQRFDLREGYDAFGTFDIIFCRYVLIYFTDKLKKEIIGKLYNSLSDEGLIFTGNYVLYDMFKDRFDSKPYNNSTYFSKRKVTK